MKISSRIYNSFLNLDQNLMLVSIRQGFIMMMPVFMIGASAVS